LDERIYRVYLIRREKGYELPLILGARSGCLGSLPSDPPSHHLATPEPGRQLGSVL
jgi:hypothetical protein